MAYGFGKEKKKNIHNEKATASQPILRNNIADEDALMNAAGSAVNEDENEMIIRQMLEETNAVLGEDISTYEAYSPVEAEENVSGAADINGEAYLDPDHSPDTDPDESFHDLEAQEADPDDEEEKEEQNEDPDDEKTELEGTETDYLEELARLSAEFNRAGVQEKKPEDEAQNAENEETEAVTDEFPEEVSEKAASNITKEENHEKLNTNESHQKMTTPEQSLKTYFSMPESMEEKQENIQPQESNNVSVIFPGIIIEGNITAPTALDIRGEIKGNVSCRDKLNISGKITGDVQGTTITMEKSKVKGDVICAKELVINEGSAVAGNIKTSSVVIAGVVKGDVEASESADIAETAVIVGNVTSASIQIARGAVLEGTCSQNYNVGNLDEFFDE